MINIKQFNVYDKEHWGLYNKLLNDKNIKENVDSIFAINSLSYVIEDSKNKIGMLKIIPEIDNFSIDMGILKEYTNLGYGQEALECATEIIKLLDEDYNKIIVRTKFANESVIRCSRKLGFTFDIEEIERCISEGEEYLVLSKYNSKNKVKTMI